MAIPGLLVLLSSSIDVSSPREQQDKKPWNLCLDSEGCENIKMKLRELKKIFFFKLLDPDRLIFSPFSSVDLWPPEEPGAGARICRLYNSGLYPTERCFPFLQVWAGKRNSCYVHCCLTLPVLCVCVCVCGFLQNCLCCHSKCVRPDSGGAQTRSWDPPVCAATIVPATIAMPEF